MREKAMKKEKVKTITVGKVWFEPETFDYMLNGKVIGEYVCDRIYQYTTCDFKDGTDIDDETMTKLSCLSKDEISDYEISPGQFGVFGWHISDLKIYDEPKELSEFSLANALCHRGKAKDNCIGCWDCELTHPPQSWCYVEEVKK